MGRAADADDEFASLIMLAGPLGPKWKLASCSGAKSCDASAGSGASAGASGSAGGSAGGGKPASAAG